MKSLLIAAWVVVLSLVLALPVRGQVAATPDYDNCMYALQLQSFFLGTTKGNQPKRINLYVVRENGRWGAGLATHTIDGRPVWNTALSIVDASGVMRDGMALKGPIKITLVPDPWRPTDGKPRKATVELDATIKADPSGKSFGSLEGQYTVTTEGNEEELKKAELHKQFTGKVSGGIGGYSQPDIRNASYNLSIYDLMPGKTADNFQRRRALAIGWKDGKAVSARLGQMDMRHNSFDFAQLETPERFTITPDTLEGEVRFTADTLEGESADFQIKLKGRRVANWVVGEWTGTYYVDGKEPKEIKGFFRGDVKGEAFVAEVAKADNRPWFVPTKNFAAPKAGEHPRLFFRKADVPELRRRAETPEGKIIVKRLRELLNGSDGESMPTVFNPATKAYAGDFKYKTGAYSIGHAAGFGMLYQLTGDAKYAELSRKCVELAWQGQRNHDDRYSWVAPGGELRAGPTLAWYALAYDLCYDAWPEDFRIKFAQAIQNYSDVKGGEWNNPEGITLDKMVMTPKQGPGSNHYGAVVGGCGIAVLAIKGDPGTDDERTTKYMNMLEKQVVRHFLAGWGDGGYYKEGWGASRVGTQGGFLSFLQALKVAHGKDYINVDRNEVNFVTMVPRHLLVVGPPAVFPYRSNMGPTYGNPNIGSGGERGGFSHGGYFSEGFGAIAEKYKPALLWTYENVFDADKKDPFDLMSSYPHRPILALVNWPTFSGMKAEDPDGIMPKATRDSLYDFFAFRNRFQDKGDIVTSFVINYPDGTKPRNVMVWGFNGARIDLGEPNRGAKVTHYVAGKDGSGAVTAGNFVIAVDYSKASGADAVILTTAIGKNEGASGENIKYHEVTVNGTKMVALVMSEKGEQPTVSVDGGNIRIGGQTFSYVDGKLSMSVFTPQ